MQPLDDFYYFAKVTWAERIHAGDAFTATRMPRLRRPEIRRAGGLGIALIPESVVRAGARPACLERAPRRFSHGVSNPARPAARRACVHRLSG
jgi:hypothetical protein